MNLFIALLVVLILGCIVFVIIRFLGDKSQPSPLICPRCKKPVSINDLKCSNCMSVGTVYREVIRASRVADSFFKCSVCKSSIVYLGCPNCNCSLRGLFMR